MIDAQLAITALLYAYAERIDEGDFAGVTELLADAEVTFGRGARSTSGRDEILELYERTTRRYADGTPRTQHLVSNAIVEVDASGTGASARSRFTVLQAVPGALALQPIIAGRYLDDFGLADGRWRFVRRHMIIDLVGDLSHHLLFDLPEA